MENYELKSDEVVLYKGEVILSGKLCPTKLILTNYNVVLITKSHSISNKEVEVQTYDVQDIKVYKDVPQIKTNKNHVEIYLTSGEIDLEFAYRNELKKFVNSAMELLTNKSLFQRRTESVKKNVDVVDKTFNIDSVEIVKGAVKNGSEKGIGKLFGSITKIFKK